MAIQSLRGHAFSTYVTMDSFRDERTCWILTLLEELVFVFSRLPWKRMPMREERLKE